MYKTTITYKDFNDVEHTEDLYFNLSVGEITDMELTHPGGYANLLQNIAKTNDSTAIYTAFKEIIDKAYGVKSADGRYFRKTPENLADFKASGAYDEFLVKLLGDGGKTAAAFVNGIMPKTNMTDDELYEKTKALIEEKKVASIVEFPAAPTE